MTSRLLAIGLVLVCVIAAAPLRAQTLDSNPATPTLDPAPPEAPDATAPAPDEAASPDEADLPAYARKLRELEFERSLREANAKAYHHYQRKEYDQAIALYQQLIGAQPTSPGHYYNIACAFALSGDAPRAMQALDLAAVHGYTGYFHMLRDKDLTTLHSDERFKEIAAKVRENDRRRLPPYEKGVVMNSLAKFEGWPDQGLRWRLRVSRQATHVQPHRLVIWMHPSGGSMNEEADAAAPVLADHGYALVTFTQKNWEGWTNEHIEQLFQHTLPAIAEALDMVDVNRPILMGFDAGGQKALELWAANPAALGGLIVSAAYPIDVVHYQKEKAFKLPPLGEGADPAATPILALIGESDQGGLGSEIWRQMEPKLRELKVPLTTHYIPGRGHEWLVDRETPKVRAWLQSLKPTPPQAAAE